MLKGKKSQNDPLYSSRWTRGPGAQQDQGHGVVLHDQGEGYQLTILEVGNKEESQVLIGSWDHYGITGTQHV